MPAMTMVFRTLRIGFPTFEIEVYSNGKENAHPSQELALLGALRPCGLESFSPTKTTHYDWILSLLDRGEESFWVCDTDIVFFDSAEAWDFGDAPIAGRFVPAFYDRFTKCMTRLRLHTSLMYFNPARIREEAKKYYAQFPETEFNPRQSLIAPSYYPVREHGKVVNWFNDTCALLYHAIGGVHFTPDQLDAYGHLGFATFSDLVAPCYPEYGMRQQHWAVFDNPQLLRGSWKLDEAFYRQNSAPPR